MATHTSTDTQSNPPDPLLQNMLASLRGYWTEARGYQRFLYFVSALLLASGIIHTFIFIFSGESWSGAVSWRKPIVFAFSFGVTCITMAWIMTFLPKNRISGWLFMVAVGIASLVEVFLITLQKWRGVPSHFNNETPFDSMVFSWMGNMVGIVGIVIIIFTVWSFFALRTTPSMAWAIRIGLILLVLGQVLGGLIIANAISIGPDNFTYDGAAISGEAGQMKVPHGVAMHAVQVLPALAWLLTFANWTEGQRTTAVLVASAGYAGLLGVSAMQTFSGRSAIDLSLLTTILMVASIIGVAVAYGVALRALAQELQPART